MQVFYQWYDHLIRSTEYGKKIVQEVEQSIDEHDFKKFMELYEFLNSLYKGWVFLPSEAFVYTDDKYEYAEMIDITIEENFNKITGHGYECG